MKHYQLVIFDWDGTIMDSVGRIVSSIQAAAEFAGIEVPDDDQAKSIIGLSLDTAVKTLFPSADVQQLESVKTKYKHHYVEENETATPLFNHAHQLFELLLKNEKHLAVATGKARDGLERAWKETKTKQYFVGSRCACESISKPDPDMVNQLMEEFNVTPENTVMIGDTVHDMEMAKRAGVDRIGVTFGVHSKVQLKALEPVAIVDSLEQLGKLLT